MPRYVLQGTLNDFFHDWVVVRHCNRLWAVSLRSMARAKIATCSARTPIVLAPVVGQ